MTLPQSTPQEEGTKFQQQCAGLSELYTNPNAPIPAWLAPYMPGAKKAEAAAPTPAPKPAGASPVLSHHVSATSSVHV